MNQSGGNDDTGAELLDNCKDNAVAINLHHLGQHDWTIYGNRTCNQDDEQETNSQLDVVISISPVAAARSGSTTGTTNTCFTTCTTTMAITLASTNAMPVND